jgi:hypothetical protein
MKNSFQSKKISVYFDQRRALRLKIAAVAVAAIA